MISTLAVANYRSIRDLVIQLGPLNVITGGNGAGKSNMYRALRLLAACAQGGAVAALAGEGGLQSTFFAGDRFSGSGQRSPRGGRATAADDGPRRLRLGFSGDDLSYSVELGLPSIEGSAFGLDPEVKSESIWAGQLARPAAMLVQRRNGRVSVRSDAGWQPLPLPIPAFTSMFDSVADPVAAPEVFVVREQIRSWRFYDGFRTDAAAPARQPRVATRTPVLHHDGRDLAAAVQTIIEIGDSDAFAAAVDDAFPGARVRVSVDEAGRFDLQFHQPGLSRPLSAAELSDGTLRFLCWAAALHTPRPPQLMVLNEPETSLHPDLLAALGRLIVRCSADTQVWAVSHSPALVESLEQHPQSQRLHLVKQDGATVVADRSALDSPPWKWPA